MLDRHVLDVGAVDGLDRHAAGFVEVVEVGRALVAPFARPSIELAVVDEHTPHRTTRLGADLEPVGARARAAPHDLDVLGRARPPERRGSP